MTNALLIFCSFAVPREEALNDDIHLKVRKVFLGGIRDGLDEETLRTYFEPYGNVVECLLMHDNQGKMRGFAFIEFDGENFLFFHR